jgi:hypothetical protein
MYNAIEPNGNDRGALDGRKQNPPERIAECRSETSFKGLASELSVKTRMGRLVNLDSLRPYDTAPISLHNGHVLPFGSCVYFLYRDYFE